MIEDASRVFGRSGGEEKKTVEKNEKTNREIYHRFLVLLPSLAVVAVGLIYVFGFVQTRLMFLHPDDK